MYGELEENNTYSKRQYVWYPPLMLYWLMLQASIGIHAYSDKPFTLCVFSMFLDKTPTNRKSFIIQNVAEQSLWRRFVDDYASD